LNVALAADNLKAEKREELSVQLQQIERELGPRFSVSSATSPRLYIHIRDEVQRAIAEKITYKLKENAVIVPTTDLKNVGPNNSELRYFRREEHEEAESIGSIVRETGTPITVRYIPGYEVSTRIRQRHFELWLSRNAILSKNMGAK
jgi:hypothetical protein